MIDSSSNKLVRLKEVLFTFEVQGRNGVSMYVNMDLTGVQISCTGETMSGLWFLHSDLQVMAKVSKQLKDPGTSEE